MTFIGKSWQSKTNHDFYGIEQQKRCNLFSLVALGGHLFHSFLFRNKRECAIWFRTCICTWYDFHMDLAQISIYENQNSQFCKEKFRVRLYMFKPLTYVLFIWLCVCICIRNCVWICTPMCTWICVWFCIINFFMQKSIFIERI